MKKEQAVYSISQLHKALNMRSGGYTEKQINDFLKEHGLSIVSEMPFGRGVMRFISAEDYHRAVAEHRAKNPEASEDSEAPDPQIHIGALETKIDRLETKIDTLNKELAGINQTLSIFVKATNHQTEQLNKVLKDLGVAT